jgi:myo-inositol-1(or 4)-monophosphatase
MILDFAIDLARQAGQVLRKYNQNGPGQISAKQSAVDLVTEADLASERLILTALRRQFPGHAILSEESPGELPASDAAWVVDPLDGTTNFAHGYPVFCVSLAFFQDSVAQIGVTYDPLRDEMFWGERGRGAWCNDRLLRVSSASALNQSLLATGFQYDRATNPDNNLAEFNYFMPRTRGVRRSGAAALELAWLAAGRLDGFWEKGLNAWDSAAGQVLITEAGGHITTFNGAVWHPTIRNMVASNGVQSLHHALLSGIATARQGLPSLPYGPQG